MAGCNMQGRLQCIPPTHGQEGIARSGPKRITFCRRCARSLPAGGKPEGQIFGWELRDDAQRETAPRGGGVCRMCPRRMTMRIAQVAPLFESIPPKLYGGTERIIF